MGKKSEEGLSVIDVLNNAFQLEEDEPESPQARFLRTGKKSPPLNNPRTKQGKAWIRANLKRVEKRKKKRRSR